MALFICGRQPSSSAPFEKMPLALTYRGPKVFGDDVLGVTYITGGGTGVDREGRDNVNGMVVPA